MIVDLDAGNTRVKWRVRGSELQLGAASYDDLGALCSLLLSSSPQRLCLGAVIGEQKLALLLSAIGSAWSGVVERVQVEDQFAGVDLIYDDVTLLGVDRWLALLGARQLFPEAELVVVDCGSAVTLDLLGVQGNHLGGYIVPGVAMMRRSLFDNTGRVKVDGASRLALAPGRSTVEAVDHGVLRLLKALIVDILHEVEGRRLLITGGDGNVFARLMGCEEAYYPHLVLDGIAVAMPG
ncbi:type III pantothenate kinase [Aestuariirhabdus sp. LZHN29]|uniref:type III pantothenate kinase n=1 Tax=Aestuariirhabdus sp. LZHN29 TaxID=3417462 RepID=UPI003CF1A8CD